MKMKIEDIRRGGAATSSHHLKLVYLCRRMVAWRELSWDSNSYSPARNVGI